MPYFGVNLPAVRAISRQVFAETDLGCTEWQKTVLELWRGARRREEPGPISIVSSASL